MLNTNPRRYVKHYFIRIASDACRQRVVSHELHDAKSLTPFMSFMGTKPCEQQFLDVTIYLRCLATGSVAIYCGYFLLRLQCSSSYQIYSFTFFTFSQPLVSKIYLVSQNSKYKDTEIPNFHEFHFWTKLLKWYLTFKSDQGSYRMCEVPNITSEKIDAT